MKEQPAISPSYDVFSRLKSISPLLFSLDQKPLFPDAYQFPLETLGTLLSKKFAKTITITLDSNDWSTRDEVLQVQKEQHLTSLGCSLFGIDTPCSLLFPQESIPLILSELLETDPSSLQLQSTSLLDTFKAFFFAQVISSIKEATSFDTMEIRVVEQEAPLEAEGYFVRHYTFQIEKTTISFLLVFPNKYIEALASLPQSKEIAPQKWLANLPLFPICIEAARSHVPYKTLKALKQGDVLLVDFPFFIPGSERARVILTYRGHPLFRAKVKNGVIKLLEMTHNQQAFQPISPKESLMNPSQEQKKTTATEEQPLEMGEDTFPDIQEEEEVKTPSQEQPSPSIPLNDLPLLVVVQLQELSMTFDQLKALQPGNLLDLDIHPEAATVQLSVEGHIIGEGDLIRIGEKIGVRIRSLG